MPQAQPLRSSLHIGLLLDSFEQPRWIRRIIEDIVEAPTTEVSLVIRNARNVEASEGFFSRLWKRRHQLLYSVYSKLDNRFSKTNPDAFELVSVEDLLQGVPVIDVDPICRRFTDSLCDEDLEKISQHRLDVALRFGFRILKGGVLNIARHGVWSYHHDDGLLYKGSPPGFWEVMTNDPVTGSMLQVLTEELDNGRVIYRSWAPTINRFSVKKNNNNYYWKTSAFVMRKLQELHDTGLAKSDQECVASHVYSRRLYKTPNNVEMFGLSMDLFGRGLSRATEKFLYSDDWWLAYRFRVSPDDPNNSFYKFKFLRPPQGHFWADPFPVNFENRYFVFFEEFIHAQNKAHISAIELSPQRIGEPVRVLEKSYHLSYPFIFEWNNSLYMIPESGENNTVELYRCKSFPYEWEFERVLLEGNNPTDATLVEVDGRWWMFVNIEEPGVSVNWEELHVYYSETPLGPWTPSARNPVKSDVRNSRPAGRLFERGGKLYRPAQDCSRRYGYATVINEVTTLDPDRFEEREVVRINPDWNKRVLGTHTINSAGDLTVIDCFVRSKRFGFGR